MFSSVFSWISFLPSLEQHTFLLSFSRVVRSNERPSRSPQDFLINPQKDTVNRVIFSERAVSLSPSADCVELRGREEQS